ncbi:MAG: hypothetical protein ACLTTP_00995 [Alistipes ihumii]
MKIKYVILPVIAAAFFALNSCSRTLDISPDGRISFDDVFADNDKTGAFLNNCYSKIPLCGYRYYFWTNWFVCTSDECFDNDADSDGSGMVPNNMYNGNISAGEQDPAISSTVSTTERKVIGRLTGTVSGTVAISSAASIRPTSPTNRTDNDGKPKRMY